MTAAAGLPTAGAHLAAGAAVAVAAAVLFALGSVVQQEVAAVTTGAAGGLDLRRLVTRPAWLAGQAATVLATGLQVVALALAPVSLVQPVLASGLVVALGLRCLRDRRRPPRVAVVGGICTTVGLAVFLTAARPAPGAARDLPHPGVVLLAVAISLLCVAAACRTGKGPVGALACGTAAGLAVAVAAVLIAAALKIAGEQGVRPALGSVVLWGAVCAGLAAELASQQAFARGSLEWSLPALTVVDPIAAVPCARLLLGEQLSAGHAAAWLPAAALAVVGVALLARTGAAAPVPRDPGRRPATAISP